MIIVGLERVKKFTFLFIYFLSEGIRAINNITGLDLPNDFTVIYLGNFTSELKIPLINNVGVLVCLFCCCHKNQNKN